jgi:uncharacterized protein (TIGR03435 family)
LKNVSLRQLIASAYPSSTVTGETRIIDRARYDIDARWRGPGGRSERKVRRELLQSIVRTNFNVQLHIKDLCNESTSKTSATRNANLTASWLCIGGET